MCLLARCCKGATVRVVSEILLRCIVVAALGFPVTDANPFTHRFASLYVQVACELMRLLAGRAGKSAATARIGL